MGTTVTTLTVDADLLRAWSEGATEALRGACAELDALNVFPVPDGDTGTNLLLTLVEAADAVQEVHPRPGGDAAGHAPVPVRAAAQALLRGALVGARGSSGVIVSQYLRGLLAGLRVPGDAESVALDAAAVAGALGSAADAAYAAVGRPVEGTVLTVAREVARGAARAHAGGAGPVDALVAALAAGHEALAATPSQLAALRRAGVLDAGGAGLLVVLGALLDAVEPGRGDLGHAPTDGARPGGTGHGAGTPSDEPAAGTGPHDVVADPDATPDDLRDQHGGEFEVMYVVTEVPGGPATAARPADRRDGGSRRAADAADGADATRGADADDDDATGSALRAALGLVGDSVAVVGGDGLWQAHVHTDHPVAALDAAARAGLTATTTGVRVRHLASQAGVHSAHRPVVGVVAVTRAPSLVADLARAGAVVVLAPPADAAGGELRRAVEDTGADDVVVLGVRGTVRGVPTGRGLGGEPRVVVLDDLDEVQVVVGAATLATLEPAPADELVDALVRAVRAVRCAVVPAAVGGRGHAEGVLTRARDLLAGGGSLVTVLTGRDVPAGVADAVATGLGRTHPGVDVVVLDAGTAGADVTLGVE